jgi:PAS domain S-box-containing protein
MHDVAAGTLRILLVEDSSDDAALIERELSRGPLRFLLRRVDREDEFVRSIQEDRPDLILSDLALPAFGGMEALRIARERCPEVPFIFISGRIGEEQAIETLKQGATDYVFKDRLARLEPVLRRAMRESSERSERRRAVQELRAAQRSLATLMSNLPGIAYRGRDDRDRTFLFVSGGIEALAGHAPADFLEGRVRFGGLIHPDDAERVGALIRKALREGRPFTVEYRLRTAAGAERWVWEQGRAVPGDEAGEGCIEGFICDVTDRKLAEERLRESEERFRLLADSAPVLIRMAGTDALFTYFNRAWLEFTGRDLARELGNGWAEAVLPEDLSRCLEEFLGAFHARRPLRVEYRLRRKDGEYRWLLEHGTPRYTPEGTFAGYIGSAVDITALKRAADEIRSMNETLERRVEERTAKLGEVFRELDAFASTVAHDLRAPLRAMQGFSQALLEDYGPRLDDTGRGYAARVVEACRRMAAMIEDLLSYSRLSRAEIPLDPVQLEAAVDEVLRALAPDLQARAAEVTVERPLPSVVGHAPTLRRVLSNLVSNAIKFTRPGTAPRLRIRSERRGDVARTWVEDEGIGIAPEHHERIFRVFERLHGPEQYPGTGVGLAIVRKAVERMGGAVGVESREGQGSRFWFDLRLPQLP